MPINIPSKEEIRQINVDVITNSTDPNEDRSTAGVFNNEGSLDFALDPYVPYEDVFEAAYGLAKAIANDHVFLNGNKRTATAVVKKLFANNGYNFNGNYDALIELVNSLVREDGDDDEEVKGNFIRSLSELFYE